MRCSQCGSDNREGRKFCTTCGTPLVASCPHCGAPIEPGERFCGECGRPLGGNRGSPLRRAGAGSRPKRRRNSGSSSSVSGARTSENLDAGERKIVTALFADIKGSMELMQDRDPEEARTIIDPALQLMIEAVRHYDGHVVQSTGDGIFALFGAPLAHEDHPQRALYAALRLQNAIRGYSAKLVAEGGTPLEARVGVNSGEVVVRTLATADGHAEYTPIGHTANLASRMEAIAPTGSIAITEHTRRLVEGFFQLKSHGPTRVKGLSDSINVYEVTGLGPLRTRLQQAAARGLSKFVGREREMEAIRHALEQAKTGHGQIVAAIAEAGVGKSRLFYEFKATSLSGCTVLEALSISHGKASAYLPVIDLLRSYFRIANEDDERARREKVAGKVTVLDRSLEDTLPYLFNLLGIVNSDDPLAQMDGQVKKRRTLEAIKRILLRESLNQALIVIFEDLHWIDEQTQELLNLLADSIGTSKILLLVNYRPEYRHEWTHKTYYTQLRLDPLAKESAQEMLTALIGPGAELWPLKRLIIDRTEGNPFFMEEIVQALFEEGALLRNGETKLTRSLSELRIPATVQVILTARIDRLPQPEKELLQTVAVLGKEFTLSLVRATAAAIGAELEQSLAGLQSAEFIYEQPAMGDTEYTFKHALTQEAAYNSILVDRRKQIHERAAQTLETLHSGERPELVDELARHYVRSGNIPKAIEYLQRAGELAVTRSSFRQAIANLNSALELVLTLPPGQEQSTRELALQVALGSACSGVMGWGSEGREAAYRRAAELCHKLEGDRELFPVLWNLCQLNIQRGELIAARELADQGLSLAERLQEPTFIPAAQYNLGEICQWRGELSQSLEHLEQASRLYDSQLHASLVPLYGVDLLAFLSADAAIVEYLLGKPDQSLKRARAAQEHANALSHPFSRAFVPIGLEWTLMFRRAAEEAREVAERSIAMCTEYGFTELLGWAKCFHGWSLIEQDQARDGITELTEGIALLDSMRDEISRTMFLGMLGEGYRKVGDSARASDLLAEALERANRTGVRFYECELHRLMGELHLKGGDADAKRAEDCFRTAVDVAVKQKAKSWELRTTTSLARLLASQGRRDEARSRLAEIYGWFTEGFDSPDLKDAKALLDELAT